MKPNTTNDHSADGRLSEALSRLARQSQRSAPPEIGVALADVFRRRHAARRRSQTLRMTAMAALLCLAAGLSFMTKTSRPQKGPVAVSIQPAIVPAHVTDHARTVSESGPAAGPATVHKAQLRQAQRGPSDQSAEQSLDFMVLPGWSSVSPREQMRIVRMELPASALRIVGAPVSEEITERPVLADFVVGQDGTPYAMRLVQQ